MQSQLVDLSHGEHWAETFLRLGRETKGEVVLMPMQAICCAAMPLWASN